MAQPVYRYESEGVKIVDKSYSGSHFSGFTGKEYQQKWWHVNQISSFCLQLNPFYFILYIYIYIYISLVLIKMAADWKRLTKTWNTIPLAKRGNLKYKMVLGAKFQKLRKAYSQGGGAKFLGEPSTFLCTHIITVVLL